MAAEYARSLNGLVHLVSPHGGEHTLCGDAQEGPCLDDEDDVRAWEPHSKGPITCEICAIIIRGCRGVKIAKNLTV